MPAVHKPKGKKSNWGRRKRHAGIYRITNKLNRCTPIDNPIKYAMKISHLFAFLDCSTSSAHLMIDQKTRAVNNEDIA